MIMSDMVYIQYILSCINLPVFQSYSAIPPKQFNSCILTP